MDSIAGQDIDLKLIRGGRRRWQLKRMCTLEWTAAAPIDTWRTPNRNPNQFGGPLPPACPRIWRTGGCYIARDFARDSFRINGRTPLTAVLHSVGRTPASEVF